MATILEEFVSLFTARADDSELRAFNQETERTGVVTDRQRPRLARFEQSLQNIGNTVGNVVGKLFTLKNAIAGTVAGVVVDKVTKQAEEMYELGEAYGLTTEKVSAFSQVASQVGVEFDDVRDAIFQTAKTMGSAFSGVGAGAGFRDDFKLDFVNVDGTKKNMLEVFDMYRKKTKDMNKAEQLNFIDEAGINENFLRVFQLGDQQYKKFMATAQKNAITTEQGKQAQEFNRTLKALTIQVTALGRAFVFNLLPYIQDTIKAISTSIDYVKEHAVLFKTFTALIVTGGVALAGYFKILAGFRSLVTFTRYMRMFGNQALIAQAKLLLIPIAVTAIIAGIALLVEDFYNFFTGGESAIGGLVKKFPELGKVIYKIRDAVMIVFTSVKATITDSMEAIIKVWDKIKPAVIFVLDGLLKYFVLSFGLMIDVVSSSINIIGDVIMGIVDTISGIFNIIQGIFTGNFSLIKDGFGQLWDGIYSLFFKPLIEGWNLAKKIVGKVASFLGFGSNDDKKDIEKTETEPTKIASNIATKRTEETEPVQRVIPQVANIDTQKKQVNDLQEKQEKKNISVLSWFTNKFTSKKDDTQEQKAIQEPQKVVVKDGLIDTLNQKMKLNNTQEKVIIDHEKEINNSTLKEKETNNNFQEKLTTNNTENNNTLRETLSTVTNNNKEINNNLSEKLSTITNNEKTETNTNNNSFTERLSSVVNTVKESTLAREINTTLKEKLTTTNNEKSEVNNEKLSEKTSTINNLKEVTNTFQNRLEAITNNKETNNEKTTTEKTSFVNTSFVNTLKEVTNTIQEKLNTVTNNEKVSTNQTLIERLTSVANNEKETTNNKETNTNTLNNFKEKIVNTTSNVLKSVENNFHDKELNNTIERTHENTITNNNTLASQPVEVVKSDQSAYDKTSKIDGLVNFLKDRLDFSKMIPNIEQSPFQDMGMLNTEPFSFNIPEANNIPLGNVHNIVNNNSTTNNNSSSSSNGGAVNSHVEVKAVNINMNGGSSKEIASNVSEALTNQLNGIHMSARGTAKA